MPVFASFQGRGALVTGASSGIGRALALRLAREGARVALVARRAEALATLAAEIRAAGGEALVFPCDVADRGAAEAAAARAGEALAGVDLLVNNAGYGGHRRFLDWDVDDIERMLRVNFLGSVYFTRALLPAMVERGSGAVVFVASVAGKIASPDESVYAASKFAVVGLASALAAEVEDAGVHVMTVCPGVIDTPFFDAEMLDRMPPAARRSMVGVDGLVDAVIAGLRRGRAEVTHPPSIAAGAAVAGVLQALAPGFLRRQVKRNTIDAVARRRRSQPT